MNRLVLFETAFLAKQKGFNEFVQNRYLKDGTLNKDGNLRFGEPIDYNNQCFQDEGRSYTSAPNQEELKNWLRINHKLSIEVYIIHNQWSYDLCSVKTTGAVKFNVPYFDTYEEALEDAIIEALKQI